MYKVVKYFLTENIVTKLSEIWVGNPGSEIRDPEKAYPGSRGQKSTGSRIRNIGIWITDTVKKSSPYRTRIQGSKAPDHRSAILGSGLLTL
jgi:hypothetical protein